MNKVCTKCHRIYDISQFYNDKRSRDGKRSNCRYCVLTTNKIWQIKYPVHAKECWKRSYKKTYTPEVCHRRRMTTHGITNEQYNRLKFFNNGKCHICGNDMLPQEHIDHNHITNKVRGLLCLKCNTAIGSFNDDPMIMFRAIDYVVSGGFVNFGGIVSTVSTAVS